MRKIVMKTVASVMLAFACGTVAMAQTEDYTIIVGESTYNGPISIGDLNFDGQIDVADIATIISIMGSSDEAEKIKIKVSETEIKDTLSEKAVDLGLPSGTKWAKMNLGANSPEEGGYYFAWGDTVKTEKDNSRVFTWDNYSLIERSIVENVKKPEFAIKKYQIYDGQTDGCWYDEKGNFEGVGDNIAVLLPEDDAAHHLWGGYWRMPTYEDFVELTIYCNSEWKIEEGVKCRKFTSKINGNYILFPAAGYWSDTRLERYGIYGYYWSATVYPWNTPSAYNLYVSSGSVTVDEETPRCYGLSIRPVRKDVKKEEPKKVDDDEQEDNSQENGQDGNEPGENGEGE